jgi:solute carrier family 25 phosphate transporter 23/24/25/41
MTLKVMREEGGIRALYRGMVPTAVGVAPYVGINFAAYEALRGVITPPDKNTIVRKLSCGALAGELFSGDQCSVSCDLTPIVCLATE